MKTPLMLLMLVGLILVCGSPVFAADYLARRDKAQWQAILAYFRAEPEAFVFHSNERDRYDMLMMQAVLSQPTSIRGLKKQSLMMQKQQWTKDRLSKGGFVPSNSMTIYLEMLLEKEGLSAMSPPTLLGVPYRYSWLPQAASTKGVSQ